MRGEERRDSQGNSPHPQAQKHSIVYGMVALTRVRNILSISKGTTLIERAHYASINFINRKNPNIYQSKS